MREKRFDDFLDLGVGHARPIEFEDGLADVVGAPFPFGKGRGREVAVAVARDVDRDGSQGSRDRASVASVAAVAAFPGGALLVLRVAEEGVELGPDDGVDRAFDLGAHRLPEGRFDGGGPSLFSRGFYLREQGCCKIVHAGLLS